MAIVAVAPGGQLVAVARYDYDDEAKEAEIALVVQDHWQEKGLGRILMSELLDRAATKGIRRFRAYVLADNRRMLDLLARTTQVLERYTERGITSLLLAPLSPGDAAEAGGDAAAGGGAP